MELFLLHSNQTFLWRTMPDSCHTLECFVPIYLLSEYPGSNDFSLMDLFCISPDLLTLCMKM
jgi:hypothetical protein